MKRVIGTLALLASLLSSSVGVASTYDDMLRAIEIDDQRTVAGLLKRGLDVDSVNPKGESLLMLAVRSGKASVVKTILAAKPKINARNAYGETALMLAALAGYEPIVKALLAAGADVNKRAHKGATALAWAKLYEHREIVAMLTRAGAR